MRLRAITACLWFGTVPWWVYEEKCHYSGLSWWDHFVLNTSQAWVWLLCQETDEDREFEAMNNPSWRGINWLRREVFWSLLALSCVGTGLVWLMLVAAGGVAALLTSLLSTVVLFAYLVGAKPVTVTSLYAPNDPNASTVYSTYRYINNELIHYQLPATDSPANAGRDDGLSVAVCEA